MKIKKIFLLFLIAILMAGCQNTNNPEESPLIDPTTVPATTTDTNESTVPAIDTFSGTEFRIEKLYGSKIVSATLHQGGHTAEIAPDDPRLIRLLNLLTFSDDQGLTPWLQGLIEDAEIQERLSSDAVMLDIIMQPGSERGTFLEKAKRIVVCEERYMIIYDGHVYYEGLVAEEFYPFGDSVLEDDTAYGEEWGQAGWIDLLEYSGF